MRIMRGFRILRIASRSNQIVNSINIRLPPPKFSTLRSIRQCRPASIYSKPPSGLRNAIETSRKNNPILFPVLLISSVGALSLLGLLAYDELTRVAPEYSAYPTAVEQRLRLALHYTHVQPDPDAATDYFLDAIKAADGCGLNPFSKESMGIRIRFSEMLENFGRVRAAIEILNNITKDCEEKVAEFENVTSEEGQNMRKHLIRIIIQTKVKIASLYEGDYIQDIGTAKKTLSDAIELLVRETKDPKAGFTEDNSAGFSLSEIASMLSQMGDIYATTGEEANAVQVYMLTLQPLRAACNGTRSCKEVQILSNIASTMDIALKKPNPKINGQPATKDSLLAARKATLRWAEQAIATADVVLPNNRDEICSVSLLSAQMTKADILLDMGEKKAAKETFENLLPKLRDLGVNNLVQVAESGLKRAS